ncbi:uncharacterized protein L201_003426 [Kwoniella dendrophila CBS 6074]|uniref:GSKIP domain-containing protein n=1 Tax=Kwoniella dendrophila CBS 6074 TaxID=1295534 RepID=A0AAX4JVE3_9TREE
MSHSSDNILLDPLPEIRAALKSNEFGISSSSIDEASSFPITNEDLDLVQKESRSTGTTSQKVVGKAQIVLLDSEGIIGIRLDRSGWTVEFIEKGSSSITSKIHKTYESLETLLIDISPSYGKAMNDEIWKRFGLKKSEEQDGEGYQI